MCIRARHPEFLKIPEAPNLVIDCAPNKDEEALTLGKLQLDMLPVRKHDSGMAVRRVLLNSGTLWEILIVIWFVARLNLVGLTAKEREVSTDGCTKYKTGNLTFISRLYGTRFFALKPSKGYFVSRLPRYPNSTSTFHSKRLVESGDISPNPGLENCAL